MRGFVEAAIATAFAGFAGFIQGLFGEVTALQTPFSIWFYDLNSNEPQRRFGIEVDVQSVCSSAK